MFAIFMTLFTVFTGFLLTMLLIAALIDRKLQAKSAADYDYDSDFTEMDKLQMIFSLSEIEDFANSVSIEDLNKMS